MPEATLELPRLPLTGGVPVTHPDYGRGIYLERVYSDEGLVWFSSRGEAIPVKEDKLRVNIDEQKGYFHCLSLCPTHLECISWGGMNHFLYNAHGTIKDGDGYKEDLIKAMHYYVDQKETHGVTLS